MIITNDNPARTETVETVFDQLGFHEISDKSDVFFIGNQGQKYGLKFIIV